MFRRLVEWARRRSKGTEDATEYDGVFSYAGEFHAFIIGLAAGGSSVVLGRPEIGAAVLAVALGFDVSARLLEKLRRGRFVLEEVRSEPWYAIGGTVVGAVATAPLAVSNLAGVLPL